jgi:hypothetical protein
MTNPAATMRMLIVYGICIPVAIFAGYFLVNAVNSPTYGTLGILGVVIALLLTPIFIKWHYPILILALHLPVVCFFLKGAPPIWQVAVILSLGIAIVERALNNKHRFLSVPSMVWPMIYTFAMALMTAKLTGGIALHALGGANDAMGGGKKYIALFLGAAAFFAIISRKVPTEQRKLYLCLFALAGVPTFFGDISTLLPSPLNYIGLLIPPTQFSMDSNFGMRWVAFGATAGVLANFMLIWYGLRGIFTGPATIWRAPLFIGFIGVSLIGGHRLYLLTYIAVCGLMFFLEGLHRTRLLALFLFGAIVGICLLVPLANKLPFSIQRSLAVVPGLPIDQMARADAEASSEWRLDIWRDTWPKVPQYLLLGKGYALTAEDFEMMGRGMLANGAETKMDASENGLALAGDYHSGPLSMLMPFGIWGAISFLWMTWAAWHIAYRNFKYGDLELRVLNIYLLASTVWNIICFLFVFGSFGDNIFYTSCIIGFSVAMNGGVCGPACQPAKAAQAAPLRRLQPHPV